MKCLRCRTSASASRRRCAPTPIWCWSVTARSWATPTLGSRAAYAWAAETSIYLRQDCRRGGLGTRLYHALEDASRAQHVQVLYACIAAPTGADDPHLSRASIDFHTRLGYAVAGTFHRCGYKFGTWYDVVWMEKRLSDDAVPPAVVPYSAQVL